MRRLQRRFFTAGSGAVFEKLKNKVCVVTPMVGFPLDAWDKGQINKCLGC